MAPDDLALPIDLDDPRVAGLKENIAIIEHLDIVNFAGVRIGNLPFDPSLRIDNRDVFQIGAKHAIAASPGLGER